MSERQIHGFIFENNYIKENSLIKENNYTAPFDAYDSKNQPYQIKTIKKGSSIDMGDFFINSKKEEDFFLIVSFWDKEKDNIVETHKLFIPCKEWNSLFYFDDKDEMKNWISNKVSNSYEYDEQWKKEREQWKKKFGNRKIALRFKRDHKSQRRIQCAINNSVFYSYFLKEFKVE